MSRPTTRLTPDNSDGTSQQGRPLRALDPSYVKIDERTTADLLQFVQKFADKLIYFTYRKTGDHDQPVQEGSWQAFVNHESISVDDMIAYIADPQRFSGEKARWLSRPHFALLLTFLELLGRARDQLGELTGRHLDYYFSEILRMQSLPAQPDQAAVVFRLANKVRQLRLPAGTALSAGRDTNGIERIYRTDRDLVINRARVTSLRSVYVHRRITGISDVRSNRDLPTESVFAEMLQIALGEPFPGDPLPDWLDTPIDEPFGFVLGLGQPIDFTRSRLFLEHHELRSLMRLVHRRDIGVEWDTINELLGVIDPNDPRDFEGNLESKVGNIDFNDDGLPQVNSLKDIYDHRTEDDVRNYYAGLLSAIGFDNFITSMPIKLRIDADWAEINRLLEKAGGRMRGLLSWNLNPDDPTAFDDNLKTALFDASHDWPPSWPWGVEDIDAYENRIRSLEVYLSMPIERVDRLVDFALHINAGEKFDWSELDLILSEAHCEKVYAERREKLDNIRDGQDNIASFNKIVGVVLGKSEGEYNWLSASQQLEQYLGKHRLGLLEAFRTQLEDATAARLYDWSDVIRVLELAQRYVEQMPEPVARKIEWRNLYAYNDATAQQEGEGDATRWKTFGSTPINSNKENEPELTFGFCLSSPLLSLSQGSRTLTVTLGFTQESFDLESFLEGLGLSPDIFPGEKAFRDSLLDALVVQISTAKGWIEPAIKTITLANPNNGEDYWSLAGIPPDDEAGRPAVQLKLVIDPSCDALAPLAEGMESWPTLRLLLRQSWDTDAKEWTTKLTPFEPLEVAAVHLGVDVEGLTDLQLQHDDRVLDPRKPFEPFGSRPAVGSFFYLSHPELVRPTLDALSFKIEWMGLPQDIVAEYAYYPGISAIDDFATSTVLIDNSLTLPLGDQDLFETVESDTSPTRTINLQDIPAALNDSSPGFNYTRRLDLALTEDLRTAGRCLRWELTPNDFGHGVYASLAALKAQQLAIAIANKTVTDPNDAAQYHINPPYTPTVKQLSVLYHTSVELIPDQKNDADRLWHIHPFGVAPIEATDPKLFPRYDRAGELYIGISDLEPPQKLSLLVQLAEGTSNPDVEPTPVCWSYLNGAKWENLDDGNLLYDSTRGLINSGTVEFDLPSATSSELLPSGFYWLRVSISRNTDSVCDAVAIRSQAVTASFEDRGNAADHYEQPLPVGTIDRLVALDARIAAIEQPFTSFGGKPAERPEWFRTRVSERLRHKQRALSPWDYERLTLQQFEQIYKAKCLSAGATQMLGQVDVVVIPDVRQTKPRDVFAPKASADLLASIQSYLSEYAPQTALLRVRNARYVGVRVRLGVRFVPDIDQGWATQQLNRDLVRYLSPWAYDDGADLMIGGSIYANSIIDFADRRDYVDYIAEIKLFRVVDGKPDLVQPVAVDYCITAESPDEVLVSDRQHDIDVISELGYEQELFTGINYMKIELDFIVG